MFRKILIANRGEIACRVIATLRKMEIAPVAVHTEAEAGARHVTLADEAFQIDSYLNGASILDVARRAGAEAIHPGYGFLSENAAFAEACAAAGIVFIGPPAAAIRAMGSKSAAKTLMEKAGVPLVPGYHGESQDFLMLSHAASQIGYPVLIKASAGGGGKGMRIVERAEDLEAAIAGAKREAAASFGDDHVLVEKYLTRPRHIEIQVFFDEHGNGVSLFERDCSIQRRHQKVLEEAPAPGMDPERRRAMSDAALAAARAVGYVGAGTVEFIATGENYWFMEMNTRLQVEHPVTEMVTGLDLVEWQVRVSAGEELPRSQDQIAINGHAIEARIYAEDPDRDFLPSIGQLTHLRQPDFSAHVRIDTGVREGDEITQFFDPMIAKLIVWGPDRDTAARRLASALDQYEVAGVRTNLDLLRAIAAAPAFLAADLDTGFIGKHIRLDQPDPAVTDLARLIAALAILTRRRAEAPVDPWSRTDSFRLNMTGEQTLLLRFADVITPVRAIDQPDGSFRMFWGGQQAIGRAGGQGFTIDGVVHRARVTDGLDVILHGRNHGFTLIDPLAPPGSLAGGDDRVAAPIPAKVTHVLAKIGGIVTKGTPLIVLEAMKMEITLPAPRDGVIAEIRCAVGDMVTEGTDLITFAA